MIYMIVQSLASPPVTISGLGDSGVSTGLGAQMGVASTMGGAVAFPLTGVEEWTRRPLVMGTGDSMESNEGWRTVPNLRRGARFMPGVPVRWTFISSLAWTRSNLGELSCTRK